MNDYTSKVFWTGAAFGLLSGMLPFMILGSWISEWRMKTSAIKANVGYYDSQTGDFKYKIMDENSSM